MTTENLVITNGTHDTNQNGSTSAYTGSNMLLVASGRYAAWRWVSNVPQGASITSATLSVYLNNSSYVDPAGTFYGLNADNVPAFTGTDNEVSAYATTTALLGWTATGLTHNQYYTHDVTSIVQEIINRGGWSAGNGIGICYLCASGVNLRIPQYDGDSSKPAKLDIVYTVAASGAAKKRRLRQGTRLGAQAGT